jgi:hypothetical protein
MFHEIINCRSPQAIKSENAPIIISSSGVIEMTTHTPRIARYQISRFCEWVSRKDNYYRYRLTPNSLTAAEEQGLKPTHLITLLRKYGQSTPPPALMKAIRRWSLKGREAFVEHLLVLKVNSPEMLVEIRNSPIQKYLGEPLNAVSIVVKPGMQEKVRAALARSGYLSDIEE